MNNVAPIVDNVKHLAERQACLAARTRAHAEAVSESDIKAARGKYGSTLTPDQYLELAASFDALPRPARTFALVMAAKGFGVFPCKPNSKEPACFWQQDATADPDIILVGRSCMCELWCRDGP